MSEPTKENKEQLTKENMLFFMTNLLGIDQLHDFKPEARLAKVNILDDLIELNKMLTDQQGGVKRSRSPVVTPKRRDIMQHVSTLFTPPPLQEDEAMSESPAGTDSDGNAYGSQVATQPTLSESDSESDSEPDSDDGMMYKPIYREKKTDTNTIRENYKKAIKEYIREILFFAFGCQTKPKPFNIHNALKELKAYIKTAVASESDLEGKINLIDNIYIIHLLIDKFETYEEITGSNIDNLNQYIEYIVIGLIEVLAEDEAMEDEDEEGTSDNHKKPMEGGAKAINTIQKISLCNEQIKSYTETMIEGLVYFKAYINSLKESSDLLPQDIKEMLKQTTFDEYVALHSTLTNPYLYNEISIIEDLINNETIDETSLEPLQETLMGHLITVLKKFLIFSKSLSEKSSAIEIFTDKNNTSRSEKCVGNNIIFTINAIEKMTDSKNKYTKLMLLFSSTNKAEFTKLAKIPKCLCDKFTEIQKQLIQNMEKKEEQEKAAAAAEKAAEEAKKAKNETFANKPPQKETVNNILLLIGKTVHSWLEELAQNINEKTIEGKQFEYLKTFKDRNYYNETDANTIDTKVKDIDNNLEKNVFDLYKEIDQNRIKEIDKTKDILNELNISSSSKCFFINNAAQGTFGKEDNLAKFRYCPLGSLIDAALLPYGGCSYNKPRGLLDIENLSEKYSYIETGNMQLQLSIDDNPNYSYTLYIIKDDAVNYNIKVTWIIGGKTINCIFDHNVETSSISAANVYVELLKLFLNESDANKWEDFQNDLFMCNFFALSTRKGLGDFLQIVNTAFKRGGFTNNNQIGNDIEKFNDSGNALRLNLASDLVSSILLMYILNNFPKNLINEEAYGGFKSSSRCVVIMPEPKKTAEGRKKFQTRKFQTNTKPKPKTNTKSRPKPKRKKPKTRKSQPNTKPKHKTNTKSRPKPKRKKPKPKPKTKPKTRKPKRKSQTRKR
jgi:hypothetical protein